MVHAKNVPVIKRTSTVEYVFVKQQHYFTGLSRHQHMKTLNILDLGSTLQKKVSQAEP